MSKYRKTISAVVTGLLGWAGIVIASPQAHISGSEWVALGVGLATALGVYTFANDAPKA